MSKGSNWGVQLARAQMRAKQRYPNQPERARHMTHRELGICAGSYALEPLSWSQRIAKIFGADHEVDISDLPINTTAWQQFKRGFRFFFTGS